MSKENQKVITDNRFVEHLQNIYAEGELDKNRTCAEMAQVQNESKV